MKVKIFTQILSITIIVSLGISNIAFAASDNVESETSQVNPIESEIPEEIEINDELFVSELSGIGNTAFIPRESDMNNDAFVPEVSGISNNSFVPEVSGISNNSFIPEVSGMNNNSFVPEVSTSNYNVPDSFTDQFIEQLSETDETTFITEATDKEEDIVTEETEIINTPSDPKGRSDKIESSVESENEVYSSPDNMPSESEQSAQVGDTFNSTFGIYQILTIGEKPTAMLVDKAQRDPNGNFIYGDTSKPWTVKYLNVDYAVTEIGSNCKLTGIPGTISIPEGVTYIHNGALTKFLCQNPLNNKPF